VNEISKKRHASTKQGAHLHKYTFNFASLDIALLLLVEFFEEVDGIFDQINREHMHFVMVEDVLTNRIHLSNFI
jgi:hypothetical protein